MNERYKILNKFNNDYVIGIIKENKIRYLKESKKIKKYFKDVNEIIIDNLDVINTYYNGRYKYEYIKSLIIYELKNKI